MEAITSSAIDALKTADDISAARTRLMEWHETVSEEYPAGELWDLVRERVAVAITIRAITLGVETF